MCGPPATACPLSAGLLTDWNIHHDASAAGCRNLDVPSKGAGVHVPGDEAITARRNAAYAECSVLGRLSVPLIRSHNNGRVHIGMQVAIDLHHTRVGELHEASLALRVISQIEFLRA